MQQLVNENTSATFQNPKNPTNKEAFFAECHVKPPSALELHSSFIPSPEEEEATINSVKKVESTLALIDDEISRLQASLAELQVRRQDFQTNLSQHRSVLSSIRKVPPEILGEIFLFAAAGCRIVWPRPQRDENAMPWLLGKVCSYWRTVVFSLPKLWTEIHMDLRTENPHGSCLGSSQDFLESCLTRSGNELLTFSIKVTGHRDKVDPLLTTLVQHSERWEDVSLYLDIFSHHSALAPAKDRVQNLRRLHIGTATTDSMPPLQLDAFENAPKLRSLSLTRLIHPFHILRLPWSQITDFTSHASTYREGEFTQIMHQTANLVSFTTNGERILEVASSEPVLLPHLRKLAIVNKGSYIAKTFQFLTTPNLETLSVHALTPFLADQTMPMLSRSQCKPTHLVFQSSLNEDAVWEENFGIVWLLGELPSITHLHLTALRSSEEIMARLHYRRPGSTTLPPFLPKLENIILEDRHCLSATKITDTLSSRIEKHSLDTWGSWPNGHSGLKSITLCLSRPPGPVFPELDVLRSVAQECGVDISISST